MIRYYFLLVMLPCIMNVLEASQHQQTIYFGNRCMIINNELIGDRTVCKLPQYYRLLQQEQFRKMGYEFDRLGRVIKCPSYDKANQTGGLLLTQKELEQEVAIIEKQNENCEV